MLENKRVYRLFATVVMFFGVSVFVISLLMAMAGDSGRMIAQKRRLYFDHKILPDHIFYPIVVAVDRVELEMAEPERQFELRLEYAHKRLNAAKDLLAQRQNDLAVVTLGKAHQYLLQANQTAWRDGTGSARANQVQVANEEFASEYRELKAWLTDEQRSSVDKMVNELIAVEGGS